MVANPHSSVGVGRYRQTFRIKEWMDARGIRLVDVAAHAGLRDHAVVSRTVRGGSNNRKVLKALKDLGCPEKYLALPKDMQMQDVA